MKIVLFLVCSCCVLSSQAQFDFQSRESELRFQLDALRASQTDSAKMQNNAIFQKNLIATLEEPTIFNQTFTQLPSVGIIDSPDNLVKIVNWNVEMADGTQRYFCYVLHRDVRKNTHKIIELIDNPSAYPSKPEDYLDPSNWYGALYYQIIPYEKNNKTYYTVLGWDGGTERSNTKLIDVINFTNSSLKLGQPVFKSGDITLKRVFFEHSEKSVMSLRYESEYKRIIFDHLSPETPTMVGFYEYYVPDMSYDAYIFDGSKWLLNEDVIGLSKTTAQVSLGKMDDKTGDVIIEKTPAKWENPTSENAVSDKEIHIAVTPEGAITDTKKAETKKTDAQPKDAMAIYDAKKRHRKEKTPDGDLMNIKKKKKRR